VAGATSLKAFIALKGFHLPPTMGRTLHLYEPRANILVGVCEQVAAGQAMAVVTIIE
jgi:hypothetical protein